MCREFGHALSNMFAILGLGSRSLSLLIRGGPGTNSGLVHVGFLVNDEALGIHFSTISPLPLSFHQCSTFLHWMLLSLSVFCQWSVFILSFEYFLPLPSVIPSLLYIHSFEYFFPFSIITLSVLCIHSFFEYIFPLSFVIPPVLSVHSSITQFRRCMR
jgi:hypothetical protein